MRPKDQGPAWETELVRRCHDAGLMAARLPEGGTLDKGDVWVGNPPHDSVWAYVGLAWKRLTGAGTRRTPDGVRDGVFITTDTFIDLAVKASVADPDIGFILEAKACQTLNVTRALHKAMLKARGIT